MLPPVCRLRTFFAMPLVPLPMIPRSSRSSRVSSLLPPAPLLLGFVLGPLVETHFRRAMIMARGDAMYFLERPFTATVLALTVAVVVWSVWAGLRRRARDKSGLLDQ